MQINSRQEVERTSEMFMLYFSRGRIVNNSLQTSNLRQGNIKLLVTSWAPLRYNFNRPAEVSVAMGEWATVNFCPFYSTVRDNFPVASLTFEASCLQYDHVKNIT
jgi:hypothetical protein